MDEKKIFRTNRNQVLKGNSSLHCNLKRIEKTIDNTIEIISFYFFALNSSSSSPSYICRQTITGFFTQLTDILSTNAFLPFCFQYKQYEVTE